MRVSFWTAWMLCAVSAAAAEASVIPVRQSVPPGFGCVLKVQHPGATQTFSAQSGPIGEMVRAGLRQITQKTSIKAAWLSLVSTQDVVGIKVYSSPGRNSGTRPAVVGQIVETLLESGLPAEQIIVWDRRAGDLRLSGFFELQERYGVKMAGSLDEGYDTNSFYETALIGKPVYGDVEFGMTGAGVGRKSYLSKLLTKQITKIVNVTPLLNHNVAGVSGVLFGLSMGSVDNVLRFEELGGERLATAIPEIYVRPELVDRVVLNIVDALICQYQGEERTLLHFSAPLNQLWFSKDPVALDVLAIEELQRQRRAADTPKVNVNQAIYDNAALLDLGIADPREIRVEKLELRPSTATGP